LVPLQEPFGLTNVGKLSSTVIHSHNLTELQPLNLYLPESTSMLTKLTMEYMYKIYYAVAVEQATSILKVLHLLSIFY
jgi:hypothetical protein